VLHPGPGRLRDGKSWSSRPWPPLGRRRAAAADPRSRSRTRGRVDATSRLLVPAVQDWVAHIGVEAGGGEQGRSDVSREEGVTAAAVLGASVLDLPERVDGEAAGPV